MEPTVHELTAPEVATLTVNPIDMTTVFRIKQMTAPPGLDRIASYGLEEMRMQPTYLDQEAPLPQPQTCASMDELLHGVLQMARHCLQKQGPAVGNKTFLKRTRDSLFPDLQCCVMTKRRKSTKCNVVCENPLWKFVWPKVKAKQSCEVQRTPTEGQTVPIGERDQGGPKDEVKGEEVDGDGSSSPPAL